LRKELHSCLRTGRAMRRAKAYTKGGVGQGQLANMVMISERPAELGPLGPERPLHGTSVGLVRPVLGPAPVGVHIAADRRWGAV